MLSRASWVYYYSFPSQARRFVNGIFGEEHEDQGQRDILELALPRTLLAALAFLIMLPASPAVGTTPEAREHRLRFFNIHSGKHLEIVYRLGDTYVQEALVKLNAYLRDPFTGDAIPYDPRVFDLLEDLLSALGKLDSEIDVICGYRTPQTNALLRARSSGVALRSLHMKAMAIDLRVPGVDTARLRDAALALGRGGVGYYAKSDFIHVDVGPVRRW